MTSRSRQCEILTDDQIDTVAQAAYEAWSAYARATAPSVARSLPVYSALDISTRARLRERVQWSLSPAPSARDEAHEQLFTAVSRAFANVLKLPLPSFAESSWQHDLLSAQARLQDIIEKNREMTDRVTNAALLGGVAFAQDLNGETDATPGKGRG